MTSLDPSTTTLQIRDARPGDAAALIALDSVAAHDPRRATQIGRWLAQGHVHVAEQDRVAVGYLVIHHHFFGEAFVENADGGPGTARPGHRCRPASPRHCATRRRQAVHLHQQLQQQHAAPACCVGLRRQRHRARIGRGRCGTDLPLRWRLIALRHAHKKAHASLRGLLDSSQWSGRPDSNRRPSAPQADALPGCATPRLMLRCARQCGGP